MLKKKIITLKNKNYIIPKIVVTTIFYDDNMLPGLDLPGQHTYFSKRIYEDSKDDHLPYIKEEKPNYRISEVLTKTNIEFFIELGKINNIRPPYKLRTILEKITEDIVDSLKISYYKKVYNIHDYYSETRFWVSENSDRSNITITIYFGNENFENALRNNTNLVIEGMIAIIKTKPINYYF